MVNLSTHFPIHQDATAQQWDVKSGKTAYIPAGKVTGNGYFPGMMKFDGSTGYYSHSAFSTSGNGVTIIAKFNRAVFSGGTLEALCRIDGPSNKIRGRIELVSSDHATPALRNTVLVQTQNSAATSICLLLSPVGYLDEEDHTVFYTFNGDTGIATFQIDGIDADDTGNTSRVAPTVGVLEGGASSKFSVGANITGGNKHSGRIGFCGASNAFGLNWSNFMHPDGTPKPLDETTWSQWGGVQPLFWHEAGKMDENKGSAGAMTKNGTITLASALA